MLITEQEVGGVLGSFFLSLDADRTKAITDTFNELFEKKFDRILAMSTRMPSEGVLTPQTSTNTGTTPFSGLGVFDTETRGRTGYTPDETGLDLGLAGVSDDASMYFSPNGNGDEPVYPHLQTPTVDGGSYPHFGPEYDFRQPVAMHDAYASNVSCLTT